MHWWVSPVSVQPLEVAVCKNKWLGVDGPGKEACQSSNTANSCAKVYLIGIWEGDI